MGITDVGLDELLHRAKHAGINGVSTEWLAIDSRGSTVTKRRLSWLGQIMGCDNVLRYYANLSPSERGGYMRLNRKVKEQYIKQIYNFCIKNNIVCGISDPDFKELNTSGSCCGMPDNFSKNERLENWTHSQLTYHIMQARRKYHKTGQKTYLKFSDVYQNESYLDESELANDHIASIGTSQAIRKIWSFRRILRKIWNNLNSPANPMNYFHGKLMPVNTDSEGNIIYVYSPLEYEERWKLEGIDLTK
jgi:hypothetical protein